MDNTPLLREIHRWNKFAQEAETHNDPQLLKTLLKGLIAFEFTKGASPVLNPPDIHVYPGIREEDGRHRIVFHWIEAERDSKYQAESREGIAPYIKETTIKSIFGDDLLPPDARERITLWETNFSGWMDECARKDNILRAYVIPGKDLLDGNFLCFLALVQEVSTIAGHSFRADLVVVPENDVVCEDTVMPVPPFGLERKLDRDRFFLLDYSPAL